MASSYYVFAFAVFSIFISCIHTSLGDAFGMTITPDHVVADDEDVNVTVSCTPGVSRLQDGKPLALSIYHNYNKPMATISSDSEVSYSPDIPSNFKATGVFDEQSNNVSMHLVIPSPKTSDAGIYSCVLLYQANGVAASTKVTSRLTVYGTTSLSTVDELLLKRMNDLEKIVVRHDEMISKLLVEVNDTIRQDPFNALEVRVANLESEVNDTVVKRLTNLETEDEAQRKMIEQTEAAVNRSISTLAKLEGDDADQKKKIEELQQKVNGSMFTTLAKLEGDDADQRKKIEELRQKVTNKPFFSATLSGKKLNVKTNSIIAFPNVLASSGGGYNKKTGVYTAPVAGTYAFHLTIQASCPNCVRRLRAWISAGSTTVAELTANEKYYDQQSSVSSVTKLKKGDLVYVRCFFHDARTTLVGPLHSKFGGYLLSAEA